MKSFNTLFRILICLFLGMSISVSCIPGDLLNNLKDMENTDGSDDTDGEDNTDDPGDGKTPDQEASEAIKAMYPPLYEEGYMALYDHMPAGIYEYTYSTYGGDKVMLMAKSSDGGGFHIPDVDDERANPTKEELGIPANWIATDGRKKGYFFDRSLHNYSLDLDRHLDTARFAVIDEYLTREDMFGLNADVLHAHSPRCHDIALAYSIYPLNINNSTIFHSPSMLVKETGREKIAGFDCKVYSVVMDMSAIGVVRKVQDLYVLDNGVCAKIVNYDMESQEGTVECSLVYADLDVGDFNDVFTKIHKRHCTGRAVLPENMYPQYTKYADEWLGSWYSIPAMAVYEGNGEIKRMSVTRTYNWKPFDNVCTIEVVIKGATYNEAVSYIAQAEEKAGINKWENEKEYMILPDNEFIIYKSWFDPCHPTCPQDHEPGDTAIGYEYVVTYMDGLLTIIFNVTHNEHT